MTSDQIRAILADQPGVVAVVTNAKGSTPRDPGAVMVVTRTGAHGTLGGGAVEHRVQTQARQMLAAQAPNVLQLDFPLGPDLDQCCGGAVEIALALVDGTRALPVRPEAEQPKTVFVYGAGHVGKAVVAALRPLDFAIRWVDARAGFLGSVPEGVQSIETPLPEGEAQAAPDDAFHLIMTHSHAVDLEITAAVLGRSFGFCGLIGSATKRAIFVKRLRERGVTEMAIARLTCPIGLPGLRDKRPAAIAASVAAQLLMLGAVSIPVAVTT